MQAFSNYHPFVLMVYFFSVIITAMFVWNPVIQLSALFGAIIFCIALQNRGEALSGLRFYIPLFVLVALTNPLFSHNGATPLFFLNGNPVTLEAFCYGAAIAVMVTGVMLWCKCCGEIMSSDKFLYLFGRIIPKLSLVLSMALRFIPMFIRQMRKVNRAQKAMGLYASKNYVDKLKGSLRVLSVMVTWSLENAMETSISMKARGYGIKGRTNYALFRFTGKDGLMLSGSIFLIALCVIGAAFGAADFFYYPRISRISVSVLSLTTYISYGLLALLPFIIETKERLKWKYCVSRI